MRTVVITQARMASTRLPGKVLKTICGKSLLEYQLERLNRVSSADQVIVATTKNKIDDQIVELCKILGVKYFRGPENDVLRRYYEAAKFSKAEIIVRVTSDCPLIDPNIIDKIIHTFKKKFPLYVYVSNITERTYPRGMDTEVFSFKALKEAHEKATSLSEREHVTPFITENSKNFQIGTIFYESNESKYRWTVDTKDDFKLIHKIISTLYPKKPLFTLEDCLKILKKNPSWSKINSNIKQKEI
tara:strand:+ start:664 stop:1395 length:732 start_codon:yes stop_codon:yes gene_type:complete